MPALQLLALSVLVASCATMVQVGAPHRPDVASSPLFSPRVFDRLAVLVEDRARVSRDQGGLVHRVEDEFMRAAIEKEYVLAARSDFDFIDAEARLGGAGITEAVALKAARSHSVSGLLLVSIDRWHVSKYRPSAQTSGFYGSGSGRFRAVGAITVRLVDVELAQVIWTASYTQESFVTEGADGASTLSGFARTVAAELPLRTAVSGGNSTGTYRAAGTRVTTVPDYDAAGIDRVAYYFQDRSGRLYGRDGLVNRVENEFVLAGLTYGYTVAARSDLPTILREQRFQQATSTDDAIARAGRAIGVSAVVVVSIDQLVSERSEAGPLKPAGFNMTATVSARMIGTQAARVLWLSSYDAKSFEYEESDSEDLVTRMSSVVAGSLPLRQRERVPQSSMGTATGGFTRVGYRSPSARSPVAVALSAVQTASAEDLEATVFPVDSVRFGAPSRILVAAVVATLRAAGEHNIAVDTVARVITSAQTRHGILGFPHFDRYVIAVASADSMSSWMVYRLESYYLHVENVNSEERRAEITVDFMKRKRKSFVDRVRQEVARSGR